MLVLAVFNLLVFSLSLFFLWRHQRRKQYREGQHTIEGALMAFVVLAGVHLVIIAVVTGIVGVLSWLA